MTSTARVRVDNATIGYDRRIISEQLSVTLPDSEFTAIIGPNACGKSTLLRAIARVLTPSAGRVLLDGKAIKEYKSKHVARQLGLLPQTSLAPDGITVGVSLPAAAPHQSLIQQWRPRTRRRSPRRWRQLASQSCRAGWWTSCRAASASGCGWRCCSPRRRRSCCSTSRRRSSTSPISTSCSSCCATSTSTARRSSPCCTTSTRQRYANHLIVMRDGRIVATGTPAEVITPELIEAVFGLRCIVVPTRCRAPRLSSRSTPYQPARPAGSRLMKGTT